MQHSQQYFFDVTGNWISENQKPNYWDSNNAYVTPGNNYVTTQLPGGGGGQTRVPVGSQQPPPPSQPTPTSTPPGIHGDLTKQPMQAAPAQPMGFVQNRNMNPLLAPYSTRSIPQTQQIRAHAGGRPWPNMQMGTHPAPTVVHSVQQTPQYIVYGQRQPGHYPNPPQIFMPPQFYQATNTQYYPQVSQLQQYQNLQSSGPSPQASTQQPPVSMMRPTMVPASTQPPVVKQEKRRRNALKIIDPDTNEEINPLDDNGTNNNNITPTRSNDSSARETPQPGAGASVPISDNTVAAEFAAKVAARAMDSQTPAQSPVPDSVPLDSVSESDALHKQPPVVPISEIVSSTLNTASEEFVPRSFTMQSLPSSEVLFEQHRPPVIVPTVSADTDSPPVDIQRPPVVTKTPTFPSAPLMQSPLKATTKKQKSFDNERQQAAAMPPPPQQQAEVKDNKKGPKSVQREESVPLPKERRDKPRAATTEQSSIPTTIITFKEGLSTPEVTSPTSIVKEIKTQVVEAKDLDNKVQHQNGETIEHEPPPATINTPVNVAVPAESNKTSKRQSGKKTGNKMRDLNRRGTEKEGSEMDAFTTEPSIMSEEKEKGASPTPVSSPTSTPPPAIMETVDKIQEDLEEKEDKMVAARNEENAKVSALNRPEPEPSPVVEEKQPPQLTLKCSYSKDQWSPLNPEGKKKYDRQFLIDLRADPMCVKKPDKLPDAVVGMLKDISNNKNQSFMNARSDVNLMLPQFLRTQSQRGGMIPKRGSQQGNKKGSRVIQMSLSLNEEVKLKTSDNAWKPNRMEASAGRTEDEKGTEELVKKVRGILNKLTPQNFDKLMEKFKILPINSENRLTEVIHLIFEKAVDEPSFSKAYAQMCKLVSKLEVTKIENDVEEKVNFRKLIITRCQTEFEKNKAAELDAEKWHEDINSCSDPDKRKEMQLAYEEKERTIRKKSVGNIRFIGELFKLGMLTPTIMYRCIEHLLGNPGEESLECLCKLLTTIGKELECNPPGKPQPTASKFEPYFNKMAELSQKRGNSKVSSRVRFMLQDVIDLRRNKWVPRREDNNPKTIEQINKEAERESEERQLALSQPPPRVNRQNDRPDNRKRNQNDADGGWSTVSTNRYHNTKFSNSAFESSKMQSVKDDLTTLKLGGSHAYRFQTGAKNAELKPSNSFTSSNAFSALSKGDERKPPQSNMNNRRMTPTPSIEREKERQRMLVGAKEGDSRSSRENSVQREKENTVSRPDPVEAPIPRRDDEKTSRQSEDNLNKAKEKLDRQTQIVIEEYLGGHSTVEDLRTEVEQLCTSETYGDFVTKALEIGLEKKAPAQRNIGLLVAALLDSNMFSTEVVIQQFGFIYEMAEDYAIDIPKFWELQAQIIVPILASQKINFSHFKDACSSVLKSQTAAALLYPVLSLLVKEKGEGFVRYLWDLSNVSLKDFLPEDRDVNAFVEEKSLHYLTGEAPKYEVKLSMDQVQEQILRLIQNSQPYEKILDFINANVGDKVEDVSFIRALVTAFCEACITGPNNINLDVPKFKQYEKLIERFVDHKEDRELACLSSVNNLCTKLQHPQGLILSLFSGFFDDNLICNESFLKWKNDKHSVENKGVSVFGLKSFFEALEEAETDDDNS